MYWVGKYSSGLSFRLSGFEISFAIELNILLFAANDSSPLEYKCALGRGKAVPGQ